MAPLYEETPACATDVCSVKYKFYDRLLERAGILVIQFVSSHVILWAYLHAYTYR